MGVLTGLLSIFVLANLEAPICEYKVEHRQKIVVLDTGVVDDNLDHPAACKDGHYSTVGDSIYAENLHGANVFGLIADKINIYKYCITSVKWYDNSTKASEWTDDMYLNALKKVLELDNVVAVNLSLSSDVPVGQFIYGEYKLLKMIDAAGITINVAIGNVRMNYPKDECFTYPACLKFRIPRMNVIASNTGDYSNSIQDMFVHYEDGTNKGIPVLSGTSQATAIFTGRMYSK